MANEQRLTDTGNETPAPRRRGRPPRSASFAQADAHDDDRLHDERENDEPEDILTDDERLEYFMGSLDQSVLPDLPALPGFHVCWLATTHQSDTIARRLRLGYQLIRAEELGTDWHGTSLKTGDYAGCVAINEMIAAKIPLSLYQRYMKQLHHTIPLGEEEKLRSAIDEAGERARAYGSKLIEGDAMADIVKRAPAPNFAP